MTCLEPTETDSQSPDSHFQCLILTLRSEHVSVSHMLRGFLHLGKFRVHLGTECSISRHHDPDPQPSVRFSFNDTQVSPTLPLARTLLKSATGSQKALEGQCDQQPLGPAGSYLLLAFPPSAAFGSFLRFPFGSKPWSQTRASCW